jgi:alkanesulfonate monooxygenase SsuD/methylene tetrahydromethanopterin reductase-like flavin-dependent oxidoreductase (luciferase family)
MRYGVVILPEHPWPRACELWCRAEELGFDHAWTYDHLSWRWLRDRPWYGSVPTLAAAAAATRRIGLGTLVAGAGLRHPAVLAKDLATVDEIAGGRVVCGLGAGGYDADALVAADPRPGERLARFTEYVELSAALLGGGPVEHSGTFYHCRGVRLVPGAGRARPIPLAVAATGPAGMRLAARLADIWVTTGRPGDFAASPFERAAGTIRAQVSALRRACAVAGRDPATLRRLLLTGVSVGGVLDSAAAFERAAELFGECGITDLVVHWPRPEFPYEGAPDVLADIAARTLSSGSRGLSD